MPNAMNCFAASWFLKDTIPPQRFSSLKEGQESKGGIKSLPLILVLNFS